MTFFRTQMLFFVWIVPVLALVLVYGMRRRLRIMERFASAHGLGVIAPPSVNGRRWFKGVLLMATVLFIAVALAGPKYGYRWEKIHQRGVDLIIALDCSRSMTASDIQPFRLERAKREVFDLLAMLQGDRVGLVAFAGTAFLQCPLTLDYAAFNLFLNTLSPDYLPVGGTDITAALTTSLNSFDPKGTADKAVILITDGGNTGADDPVKAAETLKEKQIKLFCIGVGGSDGVPIPEASGGFKKDRGGQIVLSRLDEEALKKMALVTGGAYVRSVAGDMDLDVIYKDEIRKHMQAKTLTSGRKQVWEDRFQWPLAMALACLMVELMLPTSRRTVVAAALLAVWMVLPVQPVTANDTRKGISAYEKGDFEQALKHFTDAQLNAPDKPESLYNLADAFYKTGNFDAAAAHYQQVLETDDRQLKQKALYNLGNAEFRQGNAKAAIDHYKAALAIDPDDRLTRENLEFVQKALEQQQKQQPGRDQKDQGKSDPDHEKQSQPDDRQNSQSSEKQQREQQQADQGGTDQPRDEQKQPDQDLKTEMDRQQKPSFSQADPSRDSQKASAPPQAPRTDGQAGDPGQAERMLNRLQDQPGRALMPALGKPPVGEDW